MNTFFSADKTCDCKTKIVNSLRNEILEANSNIDNKVSKLIKELRKYLNHIEEETDLNSIISNEGKHLHVLTLFGARDGK